MLHNKNVLHFDHAEDLYVYSKALADIVVPQVRFSTFSFRFNRGFRSKEYGMTIDEKLSIARGIVTPLLRKIRAGSSIDLIFLR